MSYKTANGGYYLIPGGPITGTAVSSSATADTYGSWVEFRAASGNAIYILGVSVDLPVNSTLTYVQIDIGTGGSGSETVVAQERVIGKRDNTNKYLYGNWHPEFMFPVPVPASTRIAVRVADNVASSLSHNITLHVIDQSNVVSMEDIDGYTPEKALRLILAALAGKLSGAASTTVTIRDAADIKARITATVDADGNRTAVTLDPT